MAKFEKDLLELVKKYHKDDYKKHYINIMLSLGDKITLENLELEYLVPYVMKCSNQIIEQKGLYLIGMSSYNNEMNKKIIVDNHGICLAFNKIKIYFIQFN